MVGQLTLGWVVWGTTGPRVSCPGGLFKGGTFHPTTPVQIFSSTFLDPLSWGPTRSRLGLEARAKARG